MNSRELFQAMGQIDDDLIEAAEKSGGKKKKPVVLTVVKWGALAACLVLVVGLGAPAARDRGTVEPPPISMDPPSSSPHGVRRYLEYSGSRYEFVEDGGEYAFAEQELGKSLGTLNGDLLRDGEESAVPGYDASAIFTTFALGGELYELTAYAPEFRLAVEYEGTYYLVQVVDKRAGGSMDAKTYMDLSGLAEKAEKAEVRDHMGQSALAEADGEQAREMAAALAESLSASLSDGEYEAIARAQTEGGSFQLVFRYADETQVRMYILPELGLVTMGDDYYTLPDGFLELYGGRFEGLEQPAPPQH